MVRDFGAYSKIYVKHLKSFLKLVSYSIICHNNGLRAMGVTLLLGILRYVIFLKLCIISTFALSEFVFNNFQTTEMKELYEICDPIFSKVLELYEVEKIVAIGKFCETTAQRVLKKQFSSRNIEVRNLNITKICKFN